MKSLPDWVQLVGGTLLGIFILGGVWSNVQSTLSNQDNRLDSIETRMREDQHLSDRVLILEQWRKESEQREEAMRKTQERLADAVQSLSVSIARLDEKIGK